MALARLHFFCGIIYVIVTKRWEAIKIPRANTSSDVKAFLKKGSFDVGAIKHTQSSEY
jgi:hypothetical protein